MNSEQLLKVVKPGDKIRRKCWKDGQFLVVKDNYTVNDLIYVKTLHGDDWEIVKFCYVRVTDYKGNYHNDDVVLLYEECLKEEATHILTPID